VKPADQSTLTARQKACEERLHTHSPTKKKKGVNRRPIKMDPTQLGKSRLSAERKPSTIDIKLGRGPKLKVQGRNFTKKCKETRHKKSVRFQEENKTHYFLPHHPVSMETGSTKKKIELHLVEAKTFLQTINFTESTKRKVLAITASIFDPLGLLGPAVIAYKIFLLKLWQGKVYWDELLPTHLQRNGISCFRLFQHYRNSRSTERLSVSMLPTSNFVDFVTAVNEPTKPVYTFALQTTITKYLVNFCVSHLRWHN
jgi:hypothetical protein